VFYGPQCKTNEHKCAEKSEVTTTKAVAGLREGKVDPRHPWASQEEVENSEKINSVDTILIHSANIASGMQSLHEMMLAIVIFKICRQLVGDLPPDLHWCSTPGPRWGTSFPRPLVRRPVDNF